MKVVGLTGGIGVGKSTVATMLADRGAVVVDVDALGRAVIAPDGPAVEAVVERFGEQVRASDGSIDRAALAPIVFGDPAALSDLNGISHPAIDEMLDTLLCDLASERPDAVVVLDMAVLTESTLGRSITHPYRQVIVVEAPTDVRMARLIERGHTRGRCGAHGITDRRRRTPRHRRLRDRERRRSGHVARARRPGVERPHRPGAGCVLSQNFGASWAGMATVTLVDDSTYVNTIDELEALYGDAVPAAITKEVGALVPLHRRYIEASPFVVLATSGPGGLDCSPRGDPAGFVEVVDDRTLHLPDRRGNNRIDTLRNIVVDPRIALLFLVPGIGVTLRVNGRARLSTDETLRQRYAMGDKLPATVIEITIDSVYTQCPKALIRSKLWDPAGHRTHDDVPTVGQIMDQITKGEFGGDEYDAAYPERVRQTIY